MRKRSKLATVLGMCGVALVMGAAAFAEDAVKMSTDGVWSAVEVVPADQLAAEPWIRPDAFHGFLLDQDALREALSAAPLEFSRQAEQMQAEILLPMPDGSFARFRFVESPIMEPALAAKFPGIKTYLGQGVDDPAATVRFDSTPAGFHAQILSPNGAVYIDPYSKDDTTFVTSYYKRDYRAGARPFSCLTTEEETDGSQPDARTASLLSGEDLRTYRLAVAATGEYTAYHGGTVQAGMSAIVTAVNRVTGIYEVELAIRMVLIANNDQIVYTNGATDPYTNGSGGAMLGQNQSNLDNVIGSANYDIGHVFSTGGGGVAYLAVICGSSKARGVTGLSSPIGDTFYVDYVAHEMGHQFGAHHTFNGVLSSCSGNRTSSSAYEPGSASTIMGYAGICSSDNLQLHSDPYFHSRSFDQIRSHVTAGGGSTCASVTTTSNTAPTVEAGASYTIPSNTPFTLTASGADVDGDAVTIHWEERDLGPAASLATPDQGSIPLFRSWSATTDPTRTLPRLSDLLRNDTPTGEQYAVTSRTLRFRAIARDNRAGGGGVATDNMQISVTTSAGPFRVTFPNTAETLQGPETVTWDVAGTDSSPVSTANVNILLSTDGGITFPTILVADTPNDGSEDVTLPDISASTSRIMVEAVDNIFFDISDSNFRLEPCGAACGAAAPLAEDGLATTCSDDSQCVNQATCVPDAEGSFPGVCYVPKNRYLSVAPNSDNTSPTARRLSVVTFERSCGGAGNTPCASDTGCVGDPDGTTCDDVRVGSQVIGWFGQPDLNGYVSVVDEAGRHYTVWADLSFPMECGVDELCPAGAHCDVGLGASNTCRLDADDSEVLSAVVQLAGCHISPKKRDIRLGVGENKAANYYLIEAIPADQDIADPSKYSLPLELPTVVHWGDMTGGTQDNVALPPDNSTGFVDILDQVNRFKDKGTATTSWLDLDPQDPDGVIGFVDMLRTVAGFKDEPYPFLDPCECAGLAPCE